MCAQFGRDIVDAESSGGRVGEDAREERAQVAAMGIRRVCLLWVADDERADAAARFDDAGALELRVDARHGVRVDLEIDRELAHRRELVAQLEASGRDCGAQSAVELGVDWCGVAGFDGDESHLSDYTSSLVQVGQKKGPGTNRGQFLAFSEAYFEIIFRLSAAIIILPSFSVTSPVTSTVWEMWAMSLAFFSAASPPVSS